MKATVTIIVALGFVGLPRFSGACVQQTCYYPVPCSCGGAVYMQVACGPNTQQSGFVNAYDWCDGEGTDCHVPAATRCYITKKSHLTRNNHVKSGNNRLDLAKRLGSCWKSTAAPQAGASTLDLETFR